MHIHTLLMTSALLLSLTACGADARPGEAETPPGPGVDHALSSRTTLDMELECGDRRFVMPAQGKSVRVESPKRASATLPVPGGMQDFVPVGMGCALSTSGEQFVVVEYGEVPFGCKVCEWFFIYDVRGVPMNDAIPPTRGHGETLEANNDGYRRLLSELGLHHPEIEYPMSAPR